MKLLFCIFLSISFVGVYSWTALEITDDTKEHPGYCFSVDPKVGAMEKGEVKQLEDCVKATCDNDKTISYYGCGSVAAEPPCKVVKGDKSKPYPDCCPTVKC